MSACSYVIAAARCGQCRRDPEASQSCSKAVGGMQQRPRLLLACFALVSYRTLACVGTLRLVNAAYARPGTCVTPGAATSYCCKPAQQKSGTAERTHSAKTSSCLTGPNHVWRRRRRRKQPLRQPTAVAFRSASSIAFRAAAVYFWRGLVRCRRPSTSLRGQQLRRRVVVALWRRRQFVSDLTGLRARIDVW